jgi:hypothetical protein
VADLPIGSITDCQLAAGFSVPCPPHNSPVGENDCPTGLIFKAPVHHGRYIEKLGGFFRCFPTFLPIGRKQIKRRFVCFLCGK